MALENTVAKYTVSITQDGTTAGAVQDMNNLRQAAQSVSETMTATNKVAAETTTSLGHMGGAMYSVRSAIDAVRFAAIDGGTRAGFYAIDEGIRALVASGLSMGQIIPILGGIGAAIGGGYLLWESYAGQVEDTAKKTKELTDALAKVPDMLKAIDAVRQAGRLGSAAAGEFGDYLNGKKKLYVQADGSISPNPTEGIEVADFAGPAPGVSVQTGTHLVNRNLPQASESQAQDYVNQQLAGRGGLGDTQTDAIAKLKELEHQASESTLDDIAKEVAAVHDQYQKKRDEIAATMKLAGAELTPSETTAGNAAVSNLNTGEANATQKIEDKEDAALQTTYNQLLAEEDALDKQIADDDQRIAVAKTAALNKAIEQQKQLQDLENKIDLDNQVGEARKQLAIQQTTNALIAQFQTLGKELGLSQTEIDTWVAKIKSGAQVASQAVEDSGLQMMTTQQMIDRGQEEFASGMSSAIVDFVDGTKSAKQAFGEFAASFLQDIAKMIIEQEILSALAGLGSVFGGGEVPIHQVAANGGIFPRMMAAGGFAGMVDSATYFPRFNVVAGEAGGEMMAALARPTFRSFGGIDAIVGNAGNQLLAITQASNLAQGNGGLIRIQIEHTPETQATIIQNSIKGAVTEVTHQLSRNSPISKGVKNLTA